MPWFNSLWVAALTGAIPECGYISGWGGGPPTELTTREAILWDTPNEFANSVFADLETLPVVLDVAGACTIEYMFLCPDASGGAWDAQSSYYTLDPAIVFTEAGTLTITEAELGEA